MNTYPQPPTRVRALAALTVAAGLMVPMIAAPSAAASEAAVILSMRSTGGFAPQFTDFAAVSRHVISADLKHYQPLNVADSRPILSPVSVDSMTKADVAKVDAMAKAAGLNRSNANWGFPNTADVPVLSITYRGNTNAIPSFGVGEESLTRKQRGSRAKVAKLLAYLDRRSGVPSPPQSVVITAVPAADASTPAPKPVAQRNLRLDVALVAPVITVQDWPSSAPKLASIGQCSVVSDAAAVEVLKGAQSTVRFRSEGKVWQIYGRQVLPGDAGCVT
jgi:hypothetical protein